MRIQLAALAALAWAGDDRVVVYDRQVLPPTWHKVARADPLQRTSFILAVKQADTSKLDEAFQSVSDPDSPKYQQFLTREEVNQLTASGEQEMGAVVAWVKQGMAGGANQRIEVRNDAVVVTHATVKEVEALFQTELYIYTHDNGHTVIRNFGPYSIPESLAGAIDMTEGIADFPMHRSSTLRTPEAQTDVYVVPESLGKMYGFDDTPAPATAIQMPAEFQADAAYNKGDLKQFYNGTGLPTQKVEEVFGAFDGTYPDTEATLDTQYIQGVGLGVQNWYWTSPGWMYTFANNLVNNKDGVPNVVSMSWGWSESQQCTVSTNCSTLGVDSAQYVARTNTEFQKLGAMGVTLFASSGDSGANGRTDPVCTDKAVHAVFPASSPYVTAVGATQFKQATVGLNGTVPVCGQYKCGVGGVEEAVSYSVAGFTSGGGFSNLTKMPAWQKTAVHEYLTTAPASALPPAGYFNKAGRAYPDVAALGNNFLVYVNSDWAGVGGTSASAPTWAGVAARLNDVAIKTTGKPLGFLNPLLYKMAAEKPAAFTDVVTGDNKCTEYGCFSTCEGFGATKGWDAVSGLGTPNYKELENYVAATLSSRNSVVV